MLEQFVFSLPDSSQIPIMERLAMINCDHYSTAIFKALPRKGTFFTDRQFSECICTVMGLFSPTFAPLEGHYIGSGKTKLVDPYGNGVAAATCSGDHWRQRHDIGLKLVFRDIFSSLPYMHS